MLRSLTQSLLSVHPHLLAKRPYSVLVFEAFYHLTVNSNELHQWNEYERVKVHSVIVAKSCKIYRFQLQFIVA